MVGLMVKGKLNAFSAVEISNSIGLNFNLSNPIKTCIKGMVASAILRKIVIASSQRRLYSLTILNVIV